jgi:superfamily II DNA helicase RecQ
MSYEIVTIPFNSITKNFHTDELNKFCLNKKILNRQIEFFKNENNPYWTILIEYETILESKGSEPKGLTEAGKLCYEKLREWRKKTAEKEGIPPFVIAKNSHFVEIINKETKTLEALKQINGFGIKSGSNCVKRGGSWSLIVIHDIAALVHPCTSENSANNLQAIGTTTRITRTTTWASALRVQVCL